jgi:hypothetical protein
MLDFYTKAILTVIAASLVAIALRAQSATEAYAQSGPVHVMVDGVAPYAFQYAGPMAVHAQ